MIELFRMDESDISGVCSIESASFSLPWSKDLFLRDLKVNKSATFITAKENGKVVGYGGFWLLIDEINIVNLAVHPDCRRKGLGKEILTELLKLGKNKGAKIATLEVRASNEAAIKLYEKFGFVTIAIRKAYYSDNKEDAVVMWLNPLK
jgi:[ribosomal protein S18]-alanine N-acetyltransferase